jgi:type IV pilus assembly protein PilW
MIKHSRAKAGGFSLIELLIALLISSIIIGVAISQLLGSRTLFARQEADSRIEENARYALDFLAKNIRMAGFIAPAKEQTEDQPKDRLYTLNCAAITGNSTSFNPCTGDGNNTLADHFAVWINPPTGEEHTCSGVTTSAVTTIANLFYLKDSQLRCRSYTINNNTNAASYITNSDAAIIDGIDNMQILFGLTDESNLSNTPTQYVSAATIAAMTNNAALRNKWARVVSLRIALLVGTGLDDGLDEIDPAVGRNYNLANAPVINFKDGNLRKIYTATVALNNAIQ